MDYCQQLLIKGKFPLIITYEDENSEGEKMHFLSYCFLRYHIRRHIGKGNFRPELSLLSKPQENKNKIQCNSEIEAIFLEDNEDDITDYTDTSCNSSNEG